MQEQRAFQDKQAGTRPTERSQTRGAGWLRSYPTSRIMLGAIVGLGLVAASILGIQSLTDEQTASETLAPPRSFPAQTDPPLPEGWVDPYFTSRPAGIPVQKDPPLPEGWVDPYFNPPAIIPVQEDPPLPEGWVDPYFEGAD